MSDQGALFGLPVASAGDVDDGKPWRLKNACTCGEPSGGAGVIHVRGGQNVLHCGKCGRGNGYNVPKSETGEAPRSVQSRKDIKAGLRTRILDWCRHRCWECGRRAPNVILHIGHLISVADIQRYELDESLEDNPYNLIAVCEECNLGRSARSFDCVEIVEMMHAIIRIREKQEARR